MKKLVFRLFCVLVLIASCAARTKPETEYLVNEMNVPLWWSDLPIRVYFDSSTMTTDQIVLSRTAFEIWNSALGEDVFNVHPNWVETTHNLTLAADGHETLVVRMEHIPARFRNIQKLGYCQYHFRQNRLGDSASIHSVDIVLHDELEWQDVMFITLHEAGHALGLMHDPRKSSIMFRMPLGGGMEIEDRDIDYIQMQIALMRMQQNGYRAAYQ